MKTATIAAALAAALLLPAAGAIGIEYAELVAPVENEDEVRPGTDQWIVGFYEMPDIEAGDLYMGERVVSVTPEQAFITVFSLAPDVLQAKVTLDDNVRYFESDMNTHQLFYTPNDYFVNHASNWAMNKMGLTTAWDRTLGSTAVKDVHLDSGLNSAHEEWASTTRDVAGYSYYSPGGSTADSSGCSYHGTHTAGTVAAPINNGKGFPGTAQIIIRPNKIFGGSYCFGASNTNMANALRNTRDAGGHISSNSWGGGAYSQAIHDAIGYAVAGGVIFFAAAGNGGCSNCIGAPWESQEANVIIITATTSSDTGASFNSKGWESDLSAPGVYIGSSTGPNTNSYHIMDGTSMATPYAAGVGALIKTLNPSFTRAQVESRLRACAVDLGAAGEDDTFGAGRINAACSVY